MAPALWVSPDGASARQARAALLYLEAERALARGVASPSSTAPLLRVDPGHTRAREQLDRVAQDAVLRARQRRRTVGALGILALALGTLWALLRARGAGPRRRGGDGGRARGRRGGDRRG
jgi:hypothetical protein